MSLVTLISVVVTVPVLLGTAAVLVLFPKLCLLIVKNLRRNLLRTVLISLAIVVLVVMVTMILTVVTFLDQVTEEKSQDIKLIVTERWQLPSQMPMTHARYLDPQSSDFLPELRGLIGPNDFMTWSFYGGTTDNTKPPTLETMVFMFAMNPDHIKPMMDDLQDAPDELIAQLKKDRRNVLLGKERLQMLGMKPGDRFKLYSINYKGLDLEFNILGEVPSSRYNLSGIMNADYFNAAFDDYYAKNRKPHPLDQRRLNLVWLRVRDKDAVTKVASIIENSPKFADRPV